MVMDVAAIVIICVLANSMGFVDAVEGVIRYKFRILSCVKCSVFWSTLIYFILMREPIVQSVATSFVLSYVALWIDLLIGYINKLYGTIYDKITREEETEGKDTDNKDADNQMP